MSYQLCRNLSLFKQHQQPIKLKKISFKNQFFYLGTRLIHQQQQQKKQMEIKLNNENEKILSLLSPKQVNEIGIKNFKILDCSFHLPNSNRSALDEFKNLPRIPNSKFFNHEIISDLNYFIQVKEEENENDKVEKFRKVYLGHMLPNLKTFKKFMQFLGVKRNHHILVYDSIGIFSSPRAAWLLNAYGHPKVSVLDGGLPGWIKENGQLDKTQIQIDPYSSSSPFEEESIYDMDNFDENLARKKVISYEEIVKNLNLNEEKKKKFNQEEEGMIILDARPLGRFQGKEPEPRAGISSGHIPNSISLPYTNLLTKTNEQESQYTYTKYLKPIELEKVLLNNLNLNNFNELQEKMFKLGNKKKIIFTCGSGMTACIIWFAFEILFNHYHLHFFHDSHFLLFDESWTGYALRKNSIINK